MSAERLQSFLRISMRDRSTSKSSGPFECFFTPNDPLPHRNYAAPSRPASRRETEAALPGLEALFAEHAREPRFQFVGTFAPDVAEALEAAGYEREPPTFAMTCTPASFAGSDADAAGWNIRLVDEASSDAVVAATIAVRAAGFGTPDRSHDSEEIVRVRESIRKRAIAYVLIGDVIAGAASLSATYDGFAEIAGVAVAAAMRRRGVARALTTFLLQHAFSHGAECVVLTAGSREAASVYARSGFEPSPDAMLEYRKATPP